MAKDFVDKFFDKVLDNRTGIAVARIINKIDECLGLIWDSPKLVLDEILRRFTSMGMIESLAERRRIATHEGGHLLILLLIQWPIRGVTISSVRQETEDRVGEVLGKLFAPLNATRLSSAVYEAFGSVFPEEFLLMLLAGYTADSKDYGRPFFDSDECISYSFDQPDDNSDFSRAYRLTNKRFIELISREPSKDELRTIMQIIFSQMEKLFSEPEFATALGSMRDFLFRKGTINRIDANETSLDILAKKNIDRTVMNKMRDKLKKIDMTQIIRRSANSDGAQVSIQ